MQLRSTHLVLVLFLAAAAVLPLPAQTPGPFSADMAFSGGQGMSATGKLFFNGDKVRMEMTTQGHSSVMISDQAKKTAYMLMPQQKMYMAMPTDGAAAGGRRRGPDWRAYDAANPCANMPDTTCTKAGNETVNGRLCTKWQFSGKANRTVWIDQKTGIPIKTQMENGATMDLTNVQEGAQAASLFEIPDGYQKMDMGNMMNMGRPQ